MLNTRVAYQAIFKKEKNGIIVTFPQLEGCLTQGQTIEEAIFMARNALGIYLSKKVERGIDLPPVDKTSFPKELDENCFTQFIDVDLKEYVIKLQSNKPIKKTLNIPEWLSLIAENYEINYSNVLKKALINHLMKEGGLKESEKYLLDIGLSYYT